MSWQGYVDNNLVGTGKITQAAIIGLKGGVWATSADFNVSFYPNPSSKCKQSDTEVLSLMAGICAGYGRGAKGNHCRL
jgi:hypothetical protein